METLEKGIPGVLMSETSEQDKLPVDKSDIVQMEVVTGTSGNDGSTSWIPRVVIRTRDDRVFWTTLRTSNPMPWIEIKFPAEKL